MNSYQSMTSPLSLKLLLVASLFLSSSAAWATNDPIVGDCAATILSSSRPGVHDLVWDKLREPDNMLVQSTRANICGLICVANILQAVNYHFRRDLFELDSLIDVLGSVYNIEHIARHGLHMSDVLHGIQYLARKSGLPLTLGWYTRDKDSGLGYRPAKSIKLDDLSPATNKFVLLFSRQQGGKHIQIVKELRDNTLFGIDPQFPNYDLPAHLEENMYMSTLYFRYDDSVYDNSVSTTIEVMGYIAIYIEE